MHATLSADLALASVSPPPGALTDLTQEQVLQGLQRLMVVLQRAEVPFVIHIDDDDHDAFLFKRALEKANITVEFMRFKDARQALDYLQGKGGFSDRHLFPLPNLTVLDFKLARGSGLEILEHIRNTPALAQLVVVGLTGSEDKSELQLAHRLGINDCVSKPQHLSELIELVRRITISWLKTN